MAKDGYFIVIYSILKILYENLKSGKYVELKSLSAEAYGLPHKYYEVIMDNLIERGYIRGIKKINYLGGSCEYRGDITITHEGIEYLFDNSMMNKIKNTLKDIKDITPFI